MRAPEFWSRNDRTARLIAAAAAPLGFAYGASVAWKHRFASPYRTRAKVICVGNLTVGGTGKTPLAIAIAGWFRSQAVPVAFLTRGHGRRQLDARRVDLASDDARSAGDEALLLAEVAPTIVARDRAQGARLAETEGAHVLVMDDGHQNFTLAKDLSLVVVDGETGFGNRRVVPAGPLREPVRRGLARADAIIIMGDGDPRLGFAGPVLRARLSAQERLGGQRVIAFAGIGRPAKFFDTLRAAGAELVESHAFADHHAYSHAEIANLKERAKLASAALMTTEKDFVRLEASDREGVRVLPVRATFDDPVALDRLLEPLLAEAGVQR